MAQDEKHAGGLKAPLEAWDRHQSMVNLLGINATLTRMTMETWFQCCEGHVAAPPVAQSPDCPKCRTRMWTGWVDWPIFKCMKCEKQFGAR